MERKFRVIVADDEALIGRNIARNIEKANEAFEVVKIAFDGLEALELTAQLLPDVVFSDIKMPEMDGIALIRRIAQEFPEIRTVIISGYNDFEFARDALRHQAVDYLLKPVNPDDLRATLDRLEQELLSRQRKLAPRRDHSPGEVAEHVMAYLRQNYAQDVDFAAIAGQYGFSSAYLSKIFKDYANISPGKYLIDQRMKAAKKLLRSTYLPVKAIAEQVGYPDPLHFSKSFKSATGQSPAQYRAEANGKNS